MDETIQPEVSGEMNDDEISELRLRMSDLFSDIALPDSTSSLKVPLAPIVHQNGVKDQGESQIAKIVVTPVNGSGPAHVDTVDNKTSTAAVPASSRQPNRAAIEPLPRPSIGPVRRLGRALRRFARSVMQQWWKILLMGLLGAGLGFVVIQALPTTYRASTVFVLKSLDMPAEDQQDSESRLRMAQTYVALLNQSPVIDTVIGLFGLDYTQYRNRVQFRVMPNTWLIELTVEDTDANVAVGLLATVMDASENSKYITEGLPPQDREIIESGVITRLPGVLDPQLIMIVAASMGLALSIGKVLADGHKYDTFEGIDDVQETLLLPILTSVPPSKRNMTLLFADDPGSPFSEAYQILSVRLKIAHLEHGLRILQLTSPIAHERSSDTAVNVGICLAKMGYRVLLIDANLRQPQIHKQFDLPQEPGFSNLIAEKQAFKIARVHNILPNLYVLPSGSLSPDPLSVLNMPYLDNLFEQFKTQVDIILLHTPPVLSAAETISLTAKVDSTMIALNTSETLRSSAIRAAESLRNVGAHVLGLILTDVSMAASDVRYYDDFMKPDLFKAQADDAIRQLAQSED